ncbi:MAG: hypothetical protein KDC38_15875, partial [Planctomycetes bacterium]|nr:hypothetical protein [Planctomycetota bacterium]
YYPGRTRHMHLKVEGDATPLLTTQLYFPGESLNPTDLYYDPHLEVLAIDVSMSGDLVASFDFHLPSTCTAPSIADGPDSGSYAGGTTVQLSVEGTGTPPRSYQWRRDGIDLDDAPGVTGATSPTLELSDFDLGVVGLYSCVVTNLCGSATSGTASLDLASGPTFSRGDCDADGLLGIADPIRVLDYAFSGGSLPTCLDGCDGNDDGAVDLGDAVFVLGFLFVGGPTPSTPYPGCGEDPTSDPLDCARSCP